MSWEEGSASDLLENSLKLLEVGVELLKLGGHQSCLPIGDVIVHLDNQLENQTNLFRSQVCLNGTLQRYKNNLCYHHLQELSKDYDDIFHHMLANFNAVLLVDDLEVVPNSCWLQVHHCLCLELADVRLQFISICGTLDEHAVGCINELNPIL